MRFALTSEDMKALAQKVFDLANLSLIALGFGSLLKPDAICNTWLVVMAAVLIYAALLFAGIGLISEANRPLTGGDS